MNRDKEVWPDHKRFCFFSEVAWPLRQWRSQRARFLEDNPAQDLREVPGPTCLHTPADQQHLLQVWESECFPPASQNLHYHYSNYIFILQIHLWNWASQWHCWAPGNTGEVIHTHKVFHVFVVYSQWCKCYRWFFRSQISKYKKIFFGGHEAVGGCLMIFSVPFKKTF